MLPRQEIVDQASGSLRLEALEPSNEAVELAAAWARGEVTYGDLVAAERCLLADAAPTRSGVARG